MTKKGTHFLSLNSFLLWVFAVICLFVCSCHTVDSESKELFLIDTVEVFKNGYLMRKEADTKQYFAASQNKTPEELALFQ